MHKSIQKIFFHFSSTDQHYAEPSSSSGLGACAVQDSSEDEDVPEPDLPAIKKVVDVNVFEDELSPSKEKNNCLLDNSRKINKANVDLVFHRNNLAVLPKPDTSEQDDNLGKGNRILSIFKNLVKWRQDF